MTMLVARDAVKAWLGLASPADDTLLDGLIASVSQAILADLGRGILPATYTETFDAGGPHVLRHWPVTQVLTCTRDGADVTGWRLDPAETAPPGTPQRLCGLGRGTATYRAGYEVISEAARVPATAPYTVTAQAPFGPWALDTGVAGAPVAYRVAAGVYTFDPAAAGRDVTLAYGYVPADVAQAALEWTADRYAARGRIGQSAKTLGGQETTSFVVKAMPDVVNRLLQPYRRVA